MKTASPSRKAGIYVRVSRFRDGDETLSPETQLLKCEQIAESKGLEVVMTQQDLDESAYNQPWRKRPGFKLLVDAVKNGRIQTIVVARLDRFARRSKDALEVIEILKESGGRLLLGDIDLDADTAIGNFSLHLFAALAELESGRISERVAAAAQTRALKGKGHVGTPPMWLKYDKETQQHVIREEIAASFRLMVTMRAAGRGYTSITRALNSQGLSKTSGAAWKVSDVQRYLADHWIETMGTGVQFHHRPTYRKTKDGKAIKKREPIRIENVYPPIIDGAVAFEAIAVNKRNRQTGVRNTGDAYLLQGILVCEQCGSLMKGHTVSHGRYYRCEALGHRSHRKHGRTHVSAQMIDEAVLRVMKIYVSRQLKALTSKTAVVRSPLSIERQLVNLDGRISRLNEMYELGNVSQDAYLERMAVIRLERQSVVESAREPNVLPPFPAEPDKVPTSTLRNILRRYHVRAEYPLWDERVISKNGSLRPMVRVCFQPEGHGRGEPLTFEFYAPLYRSGWQGQRQVYGDDELYGSDE